MYRFLSVLFIGSFLIGSLLPSSVFATGDEGWWDGFGPPEAALDGPVKALTLFSGELVAEGDFTQSAGVQVNHLARWDGTTWQPIGGGKYAFYVDRWTDFPASTEEPRGSLTTLTTTHLVGAVPNPFERKTMISYTLPTAGPVELGIYDLQGRSVFRTLDLDRRQSGISSIAWDGRDGAGRAVPSGVYVVRLSTSAGTSSLRLLCLR